MRVTCGQPWPIRTYPCLISESISHRWENRAQRLRQRDAVRNPLQLELFCTGSDEARGSYCSRPKDSRNEAPFRPLAEALDPYRAENRCALNSLDTDRSTTLSPGTVTANVYLQHPYRISQPITACQMKISR